MTPTQREAAARLADWLHASGVVNSEVKETIALLRGLAAEPQGEPMPGMSLMNRTIAYCAADTLRKLGYEWDGEAWVTTESQAEPVRECADNDSPWLVCKTCAAVGRCAKLPVAWRSKERINGEFDSGWKLTSNEPPQTPRTLAIEPLYIHPPQQRKPLTDDEALALIRATPQEDVTQEGWIRRQRLSWVRAIEHMHGITGEPT